MICGKRVLTASSLATALGKGHFDTRETILIEKTNREPKPYFTNDILQWGVKYEPIATWFYEYLYQATIVEFGLVPILSLRSLPHLLTGSLMMVQ